MAVVPVSPIARGEGDARAHTANVVTDVNVFTSGNKVISKL
jgi:hypothetical protein